MEILSLYKKSSNVSFIVVFLFDFKNFKLISKFVVGESLCNFGADINVFAGWYICNLLK